jgi:ferredoxin/flavodoxin---NADP+ reductase
MFRIVENTRIALQIHRIRVEAPRVARRWQPGQFAIVRPTPDGERIPLTIVEATDSTVDLIVQEVGRTTIRLARLLEGDRIADVVGPLGRPSPMETYGTVLVVAGGVGAAVAYPTARGLDAAGNRVIAVVGARTADLIILDADLAALGVEVFVTTDDGSAGRHGTVIAEVERLLVEESPDRVFTAGPIPMMRSVALATLPHAVPTVASLNPIMIDGTGMCGGCRVVVGDETMFACVDGPEFDAHRVDFDLLARRNLAYVDFEKCRLAQTLAER